MSMRLASLVLGLTLTPSFALADARFGWITDCDVAATGPLQHLAIMEPVQAPAGAPALPLGSIDCLYASHQLATLASVPPSVPTIYLVGRAGYCVGTVTEDLIVRVDDGTFRAHRFTPPERCGLEAPPTLAIDAQHLEIRELHNHLPVAPAQVAAALPSDFGAQATGEDLSGDPIQAIELPEVHAWLARRSGFGDACLVRDGRIFGGPELELVHVIATVVADGTLLLEARDADERDWLIEVGDERLSVAAYEGRDGASADVIVREARASDVALAAMLARDAREILVRRLTIAALVLASAILLAVLFVVLRRRATRDANE